MAFDVVDFFQKKVINPEFIRSVNLPRRLRTSSLSEKPCFPWTTKTSLRKYFSRGHHDSKSFYILVINSSSNHVLPLHSKNIYFNSQIISSQHIETTASMSKTFFCHQTWNSQLYAGKITWAKQKLCWKINRTYQPKLE